ncbi:MAG: putative helicase, partial [Myxococcaceae bacterium]|nr:putative helicase [Myxococcaceae bacterium]
MSDLLSRTQVAAEQRRRRGVRSELRARGVVPTPSELARRAVSRVDQLLSAELGVAEGLASARVVIVDPAVGTGVWLAAVLEQTRERGARSHLLGFDTDGAALDVVEGLLRPEAARQGAQLTLRCANTLELATPFPDASLESVRVILGNPPWAARSLSRGGALSDAWLAEFRLDHEGAPLRERRVGVLSDDYVRFFRWALEHARQAPLGALVCFVTNASFLDGPVHRGMRAALLEGFDKLELLDLGGNALLSRVDGDGPDDNVFGVRVGAALTWALRRPEAARARRSVSVSFAALRGTLPEKLSALATEALPLAPLSPSAPWFGFRPHVPGEAEHGFSLAEAFVFQREGVQTNRDAIAIARTREELEARMRQIVQGKLALPSQRHFDAARARRLLQEAVARGEACVAPLAYRPLDARFFITLAPLCHRPRNELLRASAASSLCLLAVRKDRGAAAFNLFAVATGAVDACFLSTRSSCRTRVFPSHQPDGSENLSASIATQLAARVGRVVGAHELIVYALSVLGAPRFRQRQQAAL